MSQAKANCKFCSKTDNSIQVICESRCLLCSRCQLMPGIRKLLLDHTNANCIPTDFPISCGSCPLCESAMSPSMLILVTAFREAFKKLQAEETNGGRLGCEIVLEETCNLIPNFIKQFRATYESIEMVKDKDGKDVPVTSTPITQSKRYTASIADIYEVYSVPAKANANTILECIVDCFYGQWMGVLRNNNENMVAIFMRLSNRKKYSKKTNDLKAKSIIDFMTSPGGYENQEILLFGRILGLQPKLSVNISPAWSHIAVAIQVATHCDRCLKFGQLTDGQGNPSATEFRQKLVKCAFTPKVISLKKAIRILALLSQVKHPHWTMSPLLPACIEFNCQYPWSVESISKLLNVLFYVALYDPSLPPPPASPAAGSRRASTLPPIASQHNLLAEIQKMGFGESFLTQQQQQPISAIELAQTVAAMQQMKVNARVAMLRNLDSIVKKMWGASANSNMSKSTNKEELLKYFTRIEHQRNYHHYARLSFDKAMALIDNQTINLSEFILVCIECWDCEHARTKLTISTGKITSQRRNALAGKYDSSTAKSTAVERLAIIRLLHWYSHEGESRGIDWDDVELNYKERMFPFLVPASLIEKSRNELNFLSEKIWANLVAQQQRDREEDVLAESGPYSTKARGIRTFGNSQMIYGNSMNADDYVSYEDIAAYNREQYLAAQSLGYSAEDFEGYVDEETLPPEYRSSHRQHHESFDTDEPPKQEEHHHKHHHHHHHHGKHHAPTSSEVGEAMLKSSSDAVDRDTVEILQMEAALSAEHDELKNAVTVGGIRADSLTPAVTNPIPSRVSSARPKTPLSGLPYESPQPGQHAMNMVDMLDVGTTVLTNAKLIENSYENQQIHKNSQPEINHLSGVSITSVEDRVNNMQIQDLSKGKPYTESSSKKKLESSKSLADSLQEDKEVDDQYHKGQHDHVKGKILVSRNKIRHRLAEKESSLVLSANGDVEFLNSPDKLAAASAVLDAASSLLSAESYENEDSFQAFNHYNSEDYSHCRVNNMINLSHLVDRSGTFEMDIINALSSENAVKYLILKGTKIAAKGLQKVVNHYFKTWQLEKMIRLDCNENLTLATAGAKVLGTAFNNCCRLIHLNVSNCNIGDIGFRALLQGVLNGGGVTQLLRLDLSGNGITMVSDSFAIVGKLYNLRSLDLSNNRITLDTRAQNQLFLKSMSQLMKLEAFSISYNKIQNDGFGFVCALVMNHFQDNLRILDIAGCFITSKSFATLLKLLNSCGEPPEGEEEPQRQKLRLEEVLFQDNLLSYVQLQELQNSFAKREGIKICLSKPHLGIKYPLCYDMKEFGLDEYHV